MWKKRHLRQTAAAWVERLVKGPGSKAKGKKDGPPQFAGRVQRRMERSFGAIPPSPKSTPTPRLNPFRSFGD
jgi:hypothetical protein